MKRVIVILGALVAAFAVLAASAAASTPSRTQLTGFACHRAMDPANRSVAIQAVMRPVPRTRRLSLKFELLEQPPGSGSAQTMVSGGDLGVWLSPRTATLGRHPGDVWKLNKPVSNLDAPATYRFRVTFRWLGAHGAVLATTVRRSARCVQRELRPDLLVRRVTVSAVAGRPHRARYAALIANRGARGAGPFQVLFTPGGSGSAAPQNRTIRYLAAGSTILETFTGPGCDAADPPTVVADSTGTVDDANRSNNALTVTCPMHAVAAH